MRFILVILALVVTASAQQRRIGALQEVFAWRQMTYNIDGVQVTANQDTGIGDVDDTGLTSRYGRYYSWKPTQTQAWVYPHEVASQNQNGQSGGRPAVQTTTVPRNRRSYSWGKTSESEIHSSISNKPNVTIHSNTSSISKSSNTSDTPSLSKRTFFPDFTSNGNGFLGQQQGFGSPFSNNGYPSNQQYPVSNQQYPVSNQQYPVSNQQYPINNQQYPISNQQYPVSNQQYPVSNQQYPVSNQQYPVSNQQYPSPNQQYPVSNQQYPASNQQYPASNQQYPASNQQYPASNQQYPASNQQYPASNQQYPASNQQYPASNQQYPASNQQYPISNQQYPVSNQQYPVSNQQYPIANQNMQNQFSNQQYPNTNQQSSFSNQNQRLPNNGFGSSTTNENSDNNGFPVSNQQNPFSSTGNIDPSISNQGTNSNFRNQQQPSLSNNGDLESLISTQDPSKLNNEQNTNQISPFSNQESTNSNIGSPVSNQQGTLSNARNQPDLSPSATNSFLVSNQQPSISNQQSPNSNQFQERTRPYYAPRPFPDNLYQVPDDNDIVNDSNVTSTTASSTVPDSQRFFIQYNNLPMGIERWRNKLFVTLPRRRYGVVATLTYLDLNEDPKVKSPGLRPYPSLAESRDLVSVYRPRVDRCDRLWMVDTGLLEIPDNRQQVQPPAIVVYDLNTDKVLFRYDLKATDLFSAGTPAGLAAITVDIGNSCDDTYAYIPDSATYGLIVFSLRQRDSWRVTHNFFSFEPQLGNLNVAGQRFQWNDGIFSIAVTEPIGPTTLAVFHSMISTKSFAVNTRLLKNRTLASRAYHEDDFIFVGDRGTNTQTTMHDYHLGTHVMFFAEMVKDGVSCWNTRTPLNSQNVVTLAQDHQRLVYPSDLHVSGDEVWVIATTMPRWIYGQLDTNQENYFIYRGNVNEMISGTACDPRNAG